ncbi:MAG: hypothetical protein TYPL_0360 [Candidatus Tyloplasma litorale]|nr:MAG: hypothetical protein TYPL_0360 [Mycoplasmatales bacterium]
MLKTEEVIKILKSNKKPMLFNDIWKKVKKEITSSLNNEVNEFAIKSDLYLSLMEDPKLIMVGNNKWDIRDKYSYSEIESLNKTLLIEEDIEEDVEEETEEKIVFEEDTKE